MTEPATTFPDGRPFPPGAAFGPELPGTGLTAIQRIAARRLALGERPVTVRKSLSVSQRAWNKWLESKKFLHYMEHHLDTVDQVTRDALADGELKAAAKLVALLEAQKPLRVTMQKRKPGAGEKEAPVEAKIVWVPDNETQARAAISLLDRRGERGKPVERTVSENFNFNPGEVSNELSKALRDPVVQRMLAEDPELKRRLVLELARMQPPALPPGPGIPTEPLSSSFTADPPPES